MLSQRLHFAGHHRESLAGHAGPGCLNGCVQGQQIGLLRDALDKIGDRQNLFHRSGKLRQLCTGAFRLLRGVVGEFEHITCTQRQFINRSRQLAGRLRHRLNILASIDDGSHRGAGFRQRVFGHFGHGFGVVANCRDVSTS